MKRKPKTKPLHTSVRRTWGISPITKVKDSDKKYKRKKVNLLDV